MKSLELKIMMMVLWAKLASVTLPVFKNTLADWGEKTVARTSTALIGDSATLKPGAEKLRWQTLMFKFYFIINSQ